MASQASSHRGRRFVSTAPPRICRTTRIVAAMHPTRLEAAPDVDGWFVSDFYAFNYLLHGLGAEQTWLSLMTPADLLDSYGPVVHGSPFGDQKVVLSQALLRERQLTPVTVVEPAQLVDRFLREVRRATEAAAASQDEEGSSVLLLLFCRGVDQDHLALDSTGRTPLSIAALKRALAPHVPVTLLTTACYSSAAAETAEKERHACAASVRALVGSVLVRWVVQPLTAGGSAFVSGPAEDDGSPCEQGAHRWWDGDSLTVAALEQTSLSSSSLAERSLAGFQARWAELPTLSCYGPFRGLRPPAAPRRSGGSGGFDGPEKLNPYQNRVAELTSLWSKTYVGNGARGRAPFSCGFVYDYGQSEGMAGGTQHHPRAGLGRSLRGRPM